MFVGFVLESELTSEAFVSDSLRVKIVEALDGESSVTLSGSSLKIPWLSIVGVTVAVVTVVNSMALVCRRLKISSNRASIATALTRMSCWMLPILIWDLLWIGTSFMPMFTTALVASVNLVFAASVSGWLWELMGGFFFQSTESEVPKVASRRSTLLLLVCAMIAYVVAYVAMNWGLWWNLRIPHGDSAMYEEHIWNVWHGKGFRSYLDQGLFWGEHVQFIHLFLLPLHVLWPSHLLLELCESVALASGAIPVFLIARRQTGNATAALMMSVAYLCYFPNHYLDIAIDFKTFRPIAFGVPLMLWGINSLEQRRWFSMMIYFLLALAAKEDYAIVIAPLGLWLAIDYWQRRTNNEESQEKRGIIVGAVMCLLATLYLITVVKLVIPWFRDWETVHYARYFDAFGKTPSEIVTTMVINPSLFFGELLTVWAGMYFFQLLLPLGMPLRAWSRLLVAFPLFVLLCLNEVAMQPPGPYHHFHAPIVPILLWAACGYLGKNRSQQDSTSRASWVLACSIVTMVLFSHSPLSIKFWDPGHEFFWRNNYVQDERAKQVEKVLKQIPENARVAATDYVHARLTHRERSYDYSKYPRRVADYEDRVPHDTEYIVIDRRHKYSIGEYDDLSQIRELNQQPSEWELLPDNTNGYFAILRRKESSDVR